MHLQQNQLLTDDDRKWKPRNKQAALVVRPANWIHQPLPEPRYLPSPEERAAQQLREIEADLARANAEAEAQLRRVAARGKAKPKPKVAKCKYAIRELRNIHKRKGLPAPTWEEIRAYQHAQPGYGRPLHNTRGDT